MGCWPFRFIAQGLDVRLAGMVSKAVVKMCRCKISHLLDDTLIYRTKKETHHLELFNSQEDHK